MNVAVIGGGYVGLVSAACFAELGHAVTLIESNNEKVLAINAGEIPIYEPGLKNLIINHIGNTLTVTSEYSDLVVMDLIFICVGTPQKSDGSADISYIEAASQSIGESLLNGDHPNIVIVKSTVPPGTTENLVAYTIRKVSGRTDISFAMNPEFLREGFAVKDFLHPDRLVIGSDNPDVGDRVAEAYKGIDTQIIRTGITAAETIKYTSNALLATKISFANEIGNLCKHLGVDVYEVMHGVGLDHRISPHFLNAGAGFGGSCFPKDVAALVNLAECHDEESLILKAVLAVNELQPLRMVFMLVERIGDLSGKKVAVLGLSFKDNTDDVRESRAIPVIRTLLAKGAKVCAYDPLANQNMQQIFPDITYCMTASEALSDADACLVMTEWPEFQNLDSEFNFMKNRVIIEGRQILSCTEKEGICW